MAQSQPTDSYDEMLLGINKDAEKLEKIIGHLSLEEQNRIITEFFKEEEEVQGKFAKKEVGS